MAKKEKPTLLTVTGLATLKPGEWDTDARLVHGAGQLQVRKLKDGGLSWYYRYTDADRKQVRIALGTTLKLAEARKRAEKLAERYQAGERDLRAALARDETARLAKIEADKAEAERKANDSFGSLLEAYAADLESKGKIQSAGNVRSAIKLHVKEPFPAIFAKPADEVTPDHVMRIVDRVADAGKVRTADKLRSYVSTAYGAAIRARFKSGAIPALRRFRLESNPARDLGVVEGSRKAHDRALGATELRAYWQRINAMQGVTGAMLRFHLLTGGQRVEQLSRLGMADYDRDDMTVTLRDPKGRRSEPRIHVVPIIPAAADAIEAMRPENLGPYLFTATSGHSPALYGLAHKYLRPVVADMLAAGELKNGPFTLGDLRRTVETRLAAEGVSMEIRAQLQSHGLSGVQNRHYDRHDYLKEKRAALETLHRLVTGESATVTPIRRKKSG